MQADHIGFDSWSPDGAHITASNATNNKGYVFIAAVITRNTWTSEISLVGHENTVEVASYNPHIFLRDVNVAVTTSNICSVVALGADDRSVSVWQTKSARPLIVAREVFERQIMDLSWSWDGLTLYATSSDGTLAVFNFDPEELDGIAPHSVQTSYLQKFGFVPPPLPEGFAQHAVPPPSSRITPPPSPSRTKSATPNPSTLQTNGFVNGVGGGGEVVNKLVARRGNKNKDKRIQPTTVPSASTIPSASSTTATTGPGPPSTASAFFPPLHSHSQTISPMLDNWPYGGYEADVDMDRDMEVPISALSTGPDGLKGKRKASSYDLGIDDGRVSKPRTLGGDRSRENVTVREIGAVGSGSHIGVGMAMGLPIPPLYNSLTVRVEGSEDILEARNSENDGTSHLAYLGSYES